MKLTTFLTGCLIITSTIGLSTSCSRRHGASSLNAYTTVNPNIVSYNELTMDLDPEPISYTIDISTNEGRLKLNKLGLEEAKELALVEAIMANHCATIFNPQYTHLYKGGKILRITVYGYPARYKAKR